MNTKPKPFCFTLMPFDSKFDDVYQLCIKQSCIDAGAYCERVDEHIYTESILERIYNQISKSDIVIADMTDRNPNVFYEVGYAHALGKTTILLTNNASDIPFDLKHYPHIVYNDKIIKLKEDLTKKIKWAIENSGSKLNLSQLELDIYFNEHNLSSTIPDAIISRRDYPKLNLTIHNKSINSFSTTDYRIGIITNKEYYELESKNGVSTKLPDGNIIHMINPFIDILYPNSYQKLEFQLRCSDNFYEDQKITIRIFTSIGSRDYEINIKWEEKATNT